MLTRPGRHRSLDAPLGRVAAAWAAAVIAVAAVGGAATDTSSDW